MFFTAANKDDRIFINTIAFCANEAMKNGAVTARTNAYKNFKWTGVSQTPDDGEVGYYDTAGNYVVLFGNDDKVSRLITSSNNSTYAYDAVKNALKATVASSADPSVYADISKAALSAINTYIFHIHI